MSSDSNSLEVQQCLSRILENPAADLQIRTLFPNKSASDQIDLLYGVNKVATADTAKVTPKVTRHSLTLQLTRLSKGSIIERRI